MKLATFITTHLDDIVAEFVTFARTLEPAAFGNSVAELRDHAADILLTIAAELDDTETAAEKRDKSIGQVSEAADPNTAAGAHGKARQMGGFTLPAADGRIPRAARQRAEDVDADDQNRDQVDDGRHGALPRRHG